MNLRAGFFRIWVVFSALWFSGSMVYIYDEVFDQTHSFYYVPGGDVASSKAELQAMDKSKCVDMVTNLHEESVDMGDRITIILPVSLDKKDSNRPRYIADCDPKAEPWKWRWVAYDDTDSNKSIASGIRPKLVDLRNRRRMEGSLWGLAVALGVPLALLLTGKVAVWIGAGFRDGRPRD